MSKSYDAIIVGARCAGAATAMLLARAGMQVLVVDHDAPGTDTMSTHALMRAGVMQLSRWGLLGDIEAAATPAIRAAEFIYGCERTIVPILPAAGTDALYAPRRTVLDTVLAKAAESAGAEVRYGVSCVGIQRGPDGRVRGARLRSGSGAAEIVTARFVIGADGRRSTVARLLEAPVLWEAAHSSACLFGYVGGLENDGYRWFWAPGAAAGIIPTNDGLSCVFVSLPEDRAGELRHKDAAGLLAAAALHVPEIRRDILAAEPVSAPVLFSGHRGRLRQATGPGWALVGDAGYFKDPISAHGITDALRDAEILARALIADRPDDYPRLRDALSADFFRTTDRIAAFDWSLSEAAALHRQLNIAMKAEQDWIAGLEAAAGPETAAEVKLAS
ncbi:MAG: NAD(P)/FAD-dependent oxidoreductase [Hyphomonas sp.]